MLLRQIHNMLGKYESWWLIRVGLVTLIFALVSICAIELFLPIEMEPARSTASHLQGRDVSSTLEILNSRNTNYSELTRVIRPGLFKASKPLRDNPMADKTLERIRSQLKLKCILKLSGEPVAYVNIKGEGLKQCKVGERVNDTFTVTSIGDKQIEVKIIGHIVVLSL